MVKYIINLIIRKIKITVQKKSIVKIVRNISWMALGRVYRIVLAFFVGVAVASYLKPEGWGHYSKVLTVLDFIKALSFLGIASLSIQYLVVYKTKTNEILGTFIILKISAIIFLVLFGLIPYIYFFEDDIYTLLYTVSIGYLIFASFECLNSYFSAQTKHKNIIIASSIGATLSTLLRIYGLLTQKSTIYFVSILSIEAFIIGILTIYFYQRAGWKIRNLKFDNFFFFKFIKEGWPLAISSIAIVQLYIDQIMVEDITSATELGYYSIAVRLVTICFFASGAISTSVFPTLVESYKDKTREYFEEKLQKVLDLFFLASFIFPITITFLGPYIITQWLGPEYKPAIPILQIYIWITIFLINNSLLGGYILVEKKQKYMMYKILLAIILNICLNSILIPKYKGLGAATATVISYMFSGYFGYLFFKPFHKIFIMQTKSIFSIFRYLLKLKKLRS